jgi:hypothetical protein
MQHWWNDSDGKTAYLDKVCRSAPLSTQMRHRLDWLEINLALHSGDKVPEPWDGQ